MLNFVMTILALLLLAVGIVALISPIPIGVILISVGLSTLVCVNPRARQLLKKYRGKYAGFNRKMCALEGVLGSRFTFLSNAFLETRPASEKPKEND